MTTPPNKKGLTHEFWEFAQVNTSWCTSVSAVGNSRRSPKRRDDCQKTQFAQVKWVHALQFQPLEILGVPLREATTIKRLNLLKWIWVDALQFVSAVGNSRRSPKRRDECQTTHLLRCAIRKDYTNEFWKFAQVNMSRSTSSLYELMHFNPGLDSDQKFSKVSTMLIESVNIVTSWLFEKFSLTPTRIPVQCIRLI